ncbi:hypothetical protein [Marinicella meishanensis]|uniref:hypothetical protein n=1 Tax=Marinicella meishanensis TaxID=2873263 RepID=UPI001CBD4B6B|nr:hypothetical protein [Marinicella sp. NBU2979]
MDRFTALLWGTVLILTAVNLYAWWQLLGDGPGVRGAGRMVVLILGLAVGALFAEKFGDHRFTHSLVRFGCVIGLVVVYYVLTVR